MGPGPLQESLDSARPGLAERGFYVARCAAVAVAAYDLAAAVGLEHPVWAPMSALIVSQGTVEATLKAVWGRCLGTLAGVLVAVLVNKLGGLTGLPIALQMAVAVALCAILTIDHPQMRVCLWTCPLVLGSDPHGQGAGFVATSRVYEVVLGAAVGGLMAALMALLQAGILSRRRPPQTTPADTCRD